MADKNNKREQDRPESYPKPTETDEQLKNQPEFIDEQPNNFHDKTISDIPASNAPEKENEHIRRTEDGREE